MHQRVVGLTLSASLAMCVFGSMASGGGALDFQSRVADRRAIEEVYWRHRSWPSANPGPKPLLSALLPDSLLRSRVDDDLRRRAALARFWERGITAAEVQAEIDRMAGRSRSPEVLKELFAALGSDPQRIAETLARPALEDRLLRSSYASDPHLHEAPRRGAELGLARSRSLTGLRPMGGESGFEGA